MISKFFEHFRQAFVKIQLLSELFQFRIGRAIHVERVEQHLHVSEFAIVAMLGNKIATASPETLGVNPESRKDHIFLHVTRAQRLIVIVNYRDGVLRSHWEERSAPQCLRAFRREKKSSKSES